MTLALLKRAQSEGAPVIDGKSVTFVWRGRNAPQLIGDFNNWDVKNALGLNRVAPGVWMHSLTFPRDAYIEYTYVRGDERVPDPLNSRSAPNGLGDVNHFFFMPNAAPTPLAQRKRDVLRGEVTRHVVQNEWFLVGGKRTMYLYQPPVTQPCPLVVVLDGPAYLRRCKLPNMVDNLIAQGRIQPVALALVDSAQRARAIEYACSETTVGFLLESVLPVARAQLNLLDIQAHLGAYGILGASLGGLMALYAGVRAPEVFGRVLSQSGSFTFGERDFVVIDLIRDGSVKPLKIWMDVGRFEWLLESNRRMHALLVERGYDAAYREYNGGHNYPAWRDDVWRGLEWLFGAKG